MIKQNQAYEHLFRPFPHQNPQCKKHDTLSLASNCSCPPCQTRPVPLQKQIIFDYDLQLLQRGGAQKQENCESDLIVFLNQIHKSPRRGSPNIPILDTVVFNSDGNVRYIVAYEKSKLKINKPSTTLKTYLSQKKHQNDLQYQKKKYQRDHMEFTFTQLDNQSEKLIKQFQNNIKYINPLLNRVLIAKWRAKKQQQIITQSQLNSIFTRITRKLFDFTNAEYFQVFPVMYLHQQSSYTKKVKYFREKEKLSKNFKIAEHYVVNWFSKNETLQIMEAQFIETLRDNQQQYLMYFSYKLLIFFQIVSNKMVESALISYITNNEGSSFYVKNIECLRLYNLIEVGERQKELPRSLQQYNPDHNGRLDLSAQMKNNFDIFQLNYNRLEKQRRDIQQKRQNDIHFSNRVYQSLGNSIPPHNASTSFIKSIFQQHSQIDKGKVVIEMPSQKYTENSKQL